MRRRVQYSRGTLRVLRCGGISVALALPLPRVEQPDAILAMTYVVVIFSIVIQRLTVGRPASPWLRDNPADDQL
jgi:CPA1 family monovalent cation:H+ antiporter